MAVGNSRHHVLDRILPRHFVRTAARSGVPESALRDILDEFPRRLETAVRLTTESLPPSFPEALMEAIFGAFRARLGLLVMASKAKASKPRQPASARAAIARSAAVLPPESPFSKSPSTLPIVLVTCARHRTGRR